jgi:MazG family protein
MPEPPSTDLPPIERLRAVMRLLRSDQGCPWDREQSLASLKPFLVEETYEVLDAIDGGDRVRLCEELGDLLLQVVFQAQLCAEEGSFSFDDVATAITEKLIRRHPHVFGHVEVAGAADVLRNWDAIKQGEKAAADAPGALPASALDGVPRHLPALHRANEVQKRAARQGFDWDRLPPVLDKIEEELQELKRLLPARDADPAAIREELGDLLFAAVNLSRFLGHQPEDVLHESIAKFARRFRAVEEQVRAQDRRMPDCTLAELDACWEAVKASEGPAGGATTGAD